MAARGGDNQAVGAPLARPLCWVAVAFVGGVAVGVVWPAIGPALAVSGVAVVVAAALRFQGRVAFFAGLVAAGALGFARAGWQIDRYDHVALRACLGHEVRLLGDVVTPPQDRPGGGQSYDVAVLRLSEGPGQWSETPGRVRVVSKVKADLAYGDRVVLAATLVPGGAAGNPGQFSYRRHLRAEGVHALCRLATAPTVLSRGGGTRLGRLAVRLRDRLCGNIYRTMPGPAADRYANLLCGLVYGAHAAPVDLALSEAFRRAGVIHVLVASGTQVSLLLVTVVFLLRLLALPPAAPLVAGGAVIGAYALVTGFEPSILRAALMGLVVLGGIATGLDYDLPTALALSAAVLLAVQPLQYEDVGFRLSYAATVGIAWIGLPLTTWLGRRLPMFVAGTLGLTLGAQLLCAPVLIYHFRTLSWIGLLANLPVIPVCGLLVVLGLLASTLGGLASGVGLFLNGLSQGVMHHMVAGVGWFAGIPGGYRDPAVLTPTGALVWLAVVGALGFAAAPAARRWWSWPRIGLAILGVVAVGVVASTWSAATAELTMTVFDVGTGDSILLTSPTGRRLLVDGGPRSEGEGRSYDSGSERVVPALMLRGVKRLEAVIGTHEHADHVGGLAAVLEAYPVGRVLLPASADEGTSLERLRAAAARRGVPIEAIARGQVIDLGGGVRVYVLWPPPTPVVGTGSDENNNAVVLKVVYGRTSFLLASDLEAVGEQLLLRHAGDVSATVLKVPHQGAKDSCTESFLDAVEPAMAVISVGENPYGHPSSEVLERLRQHGVVVNRTDIDGMVTYHSDGRNVGVSCYGKR